MSIGINGLVNTASSALQQQASDAVSKTRNGNDLSLGTKDVTGKVLLKYFGNKNDQNVQTALKELAKASLASANKDGVALDSLQSKVSGMAGALTVTIPTSSAEVTGIRSQAEAVLEAIADILGPTGQVDTLTIKQTSNLTASGDPSTNYVNVDSTKVTTTLGSRTLDRVIIPENFKNIIGAMHATITHCNANPQGGVAFPANVAKLYDVGFDSVLSMSNKAAENKAIAEAAQKDVTGRLGEIEDELNAAETPDKSKTSSDLAEMKRTVELLQQIQLAMNSFENMMMRTAAESSRLG